jgi:hypothetical protein
MLEIGKKFEKEYSYTLEAKSINFLSISRKLSMQKELNYQIIQVPENIKSLNFYNYAFISNKT